MGTAQRIVTWVKGHTLVIGTLQAALPLLIALTFLGNGGIDGLLVHCSPLAVTLWCCALSLPLITRRRLPEASALTYAGIVVLHLVAGPSLVVHDVLALVMLYSAIAYGKPRHSRAFIVLAIVITMMFGPIFTWTQEVGSPFSHKPHDASSSISIACKAAYTSGLSTSCMEGVTSTSILIILAVFILIALTSFIAYWQRARLKTVQLLQERNASIAAKAKEEEHVARMAERARIARDMHDVVAHTLSTVIVQADAGRYAGAHDLATARTIMQTIRTEAERAQGSLHGLFGVFGQAKAHGYADITDLIRQAQDTGPQTVDRTVDGRPEAAKLSCKAGSTAYRVVQEALTNARKYAGDDAHVQVKETWNDSGLHICVEDDGYGASASSDGHKSGYGLIGMRERIEAVGGSLQTGPCRPSGFRVNATIPYAAAEHEYEYGLTTDNATAPTNTQTTNVPVKNRKVRTRTSGISEHISQWSEEHAFLVDIAFAVALFVFQLIWPTVGITVIFSAETERLMAMPADRSLTILIAVPICILLALRRRLPRTGAVIAACFVSVHIVLLPTIPSLDGFALLFLYSACLYGGKHTSTWSAFASLIVSTLFAFKIWALAHAYDTVWHMFLGQPQHWTVWQMKDARDAFLLSLFISESLCLCVIVAALWTRMSGTNTLVLRARAEALTAEEEQRAIIAANTERAAVSSQIQEDVSQTLDAVIGQADAGLTLLDSLERGTADNDGAHEGDDAPTDVSKMDNLSKDDSERISRAFKAIATQGRTALGHMRELLSVLRQTAESSRIGHRGPQYHPIEPAGSTNATHHTA